MIPFCKPTIGKEELEAVKRVLESGMLAHGKESHAFEDEFAAFVGAKHAVFTNSCTSALKIAYKWAVKNVERNIAMPLELRIPKNTYNATYSAVLETPGTKFYWHEDIPTNSSWDKVQKVNVHYAGIKDETPCLIEDSAHRIEPNDPLVGKIRCYSFHPTKAMTTGHGGMLVTNDKDIYEFARLCNDDGIRRQPSGDKATWNYQVELSSGGYDGSDINAAIGLEQLKKLPMFNKRRQEILDFYNRELGTDWKGNLFYVNFLKDMEQVSDFINYMKEKGIGTSYHYPGNNWLGVSLPIYPLLTDSEVKQIITAVKNF